ncbi:MAG: hypothetical protein B6I20_03470 [Bacteroidetes bacterium 4572_117]|nr:MAG: hypothetical protein B6I20_03470 [Bacteroidetes bacterium 4572_117]
MIKLSLNIIIGINILFCFQINGQKLDYVKIGKQITDSNSVYYYPKLFGRYIAADRGLSVKDFRYLYYGYTFQDVYHPYTDSEYRKNLAIFYSKKEISKSDRGRMIKYANLILQSSPFDLRSLQLLDYAYYHNGDHKKSNDAEFKRKMIIKAILSTGNGIMKKTAIHVINDLHKFDLLNEMGLRYNGQLQAVNNVNEFLGVIVNDKDIKGIYFNVGRMYEISAKKLKGH